MSAALDSVIFYDFYIYFPSLIQRHALVNITTFHHEVEGIQLEICKSISESTWCRIDWWSMKPVADGNKVDSGTWN